MKGLLTGDGVRYLFTSFVSNFRNFSAVAIILVVMIGVGLAEAAGLIGALIRKLVGVSSKSTLTFIIVLLGIISSIASDAGYLVLIPLGAAAFASVGRNPLAGHRRGVRRRRRGLRRELPDHAARRRTHGDHERRKRARGRPAQDRHRREPLLRDRLDRLRRDRPDDHLRAARRGPPRPVRPRRRRRDHRRDGGAGGVSRRRGARPALRPLGDRRGAARRRAPHGHPGRAAAQSRSPERSSATRR